MLAHLFVNRQIATASQHYCSGFAALQKRRGSKAGVPLHSTS
ncbi:hypothetical protein HMPREF3034_00093 [Prevotella sp. DNF00663]|nr:hypothetical protein HMPREF3034_00093 [Prevotella sp. DNF00663]